MADAPVYDVHCHLSLRRLTAVVPSPDGTWLAIAAQRLDDADDPKRFVSDLWALHLDRDSDPIQLTRGASNDTAPAFLADGSLAFLSDRPVDEAGNGDAPKRTQVWVLPVVGGEPRPLTDEPLGVEAFATAARADRLVVRTRRLPGVDDDDEQRKIADDRARHGPSVLRYRELPARYWDHWLPEARVHLVSLRADGSERTVLTADAAVDREYESAELVVSADGRWLATHRRTNGAADRIFDMSLVMFDLETGSPRDLCGAEPGVSYRGFVFSHAGDTLVVDRHHRQRGCLGRPEIVAFDLGSGQMRRVIAADHAWDAWASVAGFTTDDRRLVITADWRGTVPVFVVDLETCSVTRVTAESSGGSHDSVHVLPGRARVVGLRHRLTHPPEPFEVDLAEGATPRLLAGLSGLSPEQGQAMAHIESFEVVSTDSVPVQSFLLSPPDAEVEPPVAMWIHGGPIGQWADAWHWRWNSLLAVARGLAVALPNPRGSTGVGQEFIEGIWGNEWGGQCMDDVLAVADALRERDEVDGDRMAAMGGSFGGYMTNLLGGRTGDRFDCLVTHASVFDLGAFYGGTDLPPWRVFETGVAPYEVADYETFVRHSPHRFVGGWTSPTLVVHGEKDYRVPITEGLALFEYLRAHDVEAELVVFPDEGHWIQKPRNIVAWYEVTLDFLVRHLERDRS